MNDRTKSDEDVAEQLRYERELSDKIISNTADFIFALDRDLRVVVWNTTAERVTGISVEQARGRPIAEIGEALRLIGNEAACRRVLDGETIRINERAIFIKAFGIEAVLDVIVTPLRDASGSVEGVLGIGHDITRYKRATEELVASEALLSEAQALAHVGSWRLDFAEEKAQWSDEMFRIAGRPPQREIPFGSLLAMVHPDDRDRVNAVRKDVAETHEVVAHEVRIIRPDGTERIVESRVAPLVGQDNTAIGLRGTWLDITEHKRAEEKLRGAHDELKKTLNDLRAAQEQVIQTEKIVALGTMAAGVAHELNNPLMGVMSYVSYARRNPTGPRIDEFLDRAEHELARMRDLIASMLSFAHPSEGELADVSVLPLLDHALHLLGADLKVRGIEVRVEFGKDFPMVRAKGPQLEQALLNLLLNARDAVSTGRPEKRINVDGWFGEEQVCIEVSDTGPGVPDAIRTRIFDPFFTTKKPGEGTGLGLSVSRTVITDMGGELTLVSKEDEGARFRITLKRSAAGTS